MSYVIYLYCISVNEYMSPIEQDDKGIDRVRLSVYRIIFIAQYNSVFPVDNISSEINYATP